MGASASKESPTVDEPLRANRVFNLKARDYPEFMRSYSGKSHENHVVPSASNPQVFYICDQGFELPVFTGIPYHGRVIGISVPAQLNSLDRGTVQRAPTITSVAFQKGSCVSVLGYELFCNCQISFIVIPASVSKIEAKCFHGCQSLRVLTFEQGSKLSSIGYKAFEGTSLREIILPSNLIVLETGALVGTLKNGSIYFENNSKLTTIETDSFPDELRLLELPASLKSIESNAFHRVLHLILDESNPWLLNHMGFIIDKNTKVLVLNTQIHPITKLVVPRYIRGIGKNVFENQLQLEELVFETGSELEELGSSAFHRTSIASLVIPASVKLIRSKCFCHCHNLCSVEFESGSRLRRLGYKAFGHAKITEFSFPQHLCKIGGAFYGCIDMNSPKLNAHFVVQNGVIFDKARTTAVLSVGATDVVLPRSVTTIGACCFAYSHVVSVSAAKFSQLRTIGCRAFAHSSLQNITFPRKVERYEHLIFAGCRQLASITFDPKCSIATRLYNDYRREGQPMGVVEGYKNQTFTEFADISFTGVEIKGDEYCGTMQLFGGFF